MKVRAGSCYVFLPCLMDLAMPQHYDAVKGQVVRVVNLPMAPKCNTMGQCNIEDAQTKEFLGMVSTNSLEPLTPAEYRAYLHRTEGASCARV